MCLKSTSMACHHHHPTSKPLNPHAKSWDPEAQKKLFTFGDGIKYTHQIYALQPPPPIAAVCGHPLHLQQPVAVAPPYSTSLPPLVHSQPPPLHHYCMPQQWQHSFIFVGNGGFGVVENEYKMDEELEEKERFLKRLLKISPSHENKKFVPRRTRKGHLVWKKKTPPFSAAAVPLASPPTSPKKETQPFNSPTIMIKNIPNQYRRDNLMGFLDDYCRLHGLEYDFFYLPMDFCSGANLGYAFVNFTTASSALKIKEVLEGHKWVAFDSKKICEITWARIQGKDSLVKHFAMSNFICDRIDYLPVVLSPPRNGFSTNSSSLTPLGQLRGLPHNYKPLKKITKEVAN